MPREIINIRTNANNICKAQWHPEKTLELVAYGTDKKRSKAEEISSLILVEIKIGVVIKERALQNTKQKPEPLFQKTNLVLTFAEMTEQMGPKQWPTFTAVSKTWSNSLGKIIF